MIRVDNAVKFAILDIGHYAIADRVHPFENETIGATPRQIEVLKLFINIIILRATCFVILSTKLFNQRAIKGAIFNLNYTLHFYLRAIMQYVDLLLKTPQSLSFRAVGQIFLVDFKNFDSNLLLSIQISCQLDPKMRISHVNKIIRSDLLCEATSTDRALNQVLIIKHLARGQILLNHWLILLLVVRSRIVNGCFVTILRLIISGVHNK